MARLHTYTIRLWVVFMHMILDDKVIILHSIKDPVAFTLVTSLLAAEEMTTAIEFAHKSLQRSVRKAKNAPAILHAARVAEFTQKLGGNPLAVKLALLHDVLKDGDASIERLQRSFGKTVADGVVALTKPFLGTRSVRRHCYHAVLLCSSEEVQIVKLADFIDNTRFPLGTPGGVKTLRNAEQFLRRLWAKKPSSRMQRVLAQVGTMLSDSASADRPRSHPDATAI